MGSGGRPRRYSRQQIAEALRLTSGNVSAAARLLGCDRVTVWRYQQRRTRQLAQDAVRRTEVLDQGWEVGW